MSELEAPPVGTTAEDCCWDVEDGNVLLPTPDTVGCALADPDMFDTFGVNGLAPAGAGVAELGVGLGVEFSLLKAFLLADGPFG